MAFGKISSGLDTPNDVNVIIEIPAHSNPIKYEVDKATGALFVDRFMSTSMHYPCNYGYVPHTLSEDGDPVDVLVVTPFALNPGAVVRSRPIGMLEMTDESGRDTKVLAVPVDKLTTMYKHVKTPQDLGEHLLSQITHFFEHYKDLEKGKWVKVESWKQADAAKEEIIASIKRYQKDKNS